MPREQPGWWWWRQLLLSSYYQGLSWSVITKVSEKTQNVPKKFCSLKSWFCGFIKDDIFWNFQNWSTRTLRIWVSIYRQSQADCLYEYRQLLLLFCLHLGQKRNKFLQLFNEPIWKNPKVLTFILPTLI